MDFKTLIMLLCICVAVMAWWSNNSKRNKVLCTFNRVNKTQVVKWVKMQSRYVICDGCKYDIVPDRVMWRWFDTGIINMIFPQFVPCLTFSHISRWPLNPNTNTYAPESPETRGALNKEEWVKSYYKGAVPQNKGGVKSGFGGLLQQWLPFVAIGLVVIVFIYFNSKMSGFGHTLDAVIGKLNSIAK